MRIFLFIALVALIFTQLSCATGPSSGVAGSATANVATGDVDVSVDQSFTVSFTAAVDTSTVTTNSFYVVPTEEGAESSLIKFTHFDIELYNSDNAIEGVVTCESSTQCSLIPTTDLEAGTEYAICLTSAIQFEDVDTYGYFEGMVQLFTTEAADDDAIEGEEEEEEEEVEEEEADVTAPTPGNSGTVTTDEVTSLALMLNWTKATDETSDQANLQYKVVKSSSDNISTVTTAEANGTVVSTSWEQDIATLDVEDLLPSTTYYFNVLVKDEAGNKSVYSTVTETTNDAIVMFATDAYNGDLLTAGGKATARLSADFICSTKKDAEYADLGCNITMAFLTFSAEDEVRDMPANYDTPEDQAIVGPTGIQIATDWADLLDGAIENSMSDAGVTSLYYKTGTDSDGSLDGGGNCVGYTSSDDGDGTELGNCNSTGANWLADRWSNICSRERPHLCICWTGIL